MTTGDFKFSTTASGNYQIVCDTNRDSVFDPSGDDLLLSGPARPGANTVTWTGLDASNNPVPAGDYSCQLVVTVGELHYIALDIETLFAGMRLYEVLKQGATYSRRPLQMFWSHRRVGFSGIVDSTASVGAVVVGEGEDVLEIEWHFRLVGA